jgi:uncharacterized protein (DUF427 family)
MALKMRGYVMASVPQLRFDKAAQRVRVRHGAQTICDTTAAVLVWEPRRIVPMYAVPEDSIGAELVPAGEPVLVAPAGLPPVMGPADFATHTCPGQPLDVIVDGERIGSAAFRLHDPELAGHVLLDFSAFDWLEEDQPAVGHPHDPFKRIDTLPSSRHVVVSLDGTVLADTVRPVALFETHLPTRWYLPRDDIRMDLLEASDHRTTCAYKGQASYFSVVGAGDAGRAIAWTYTDPLRDATSVRDMVCFFAERSDLTVDGEPVVRPVTPWSSPREQQALFDRVGDISSYEFG